MIPEGDRGLFFDENSRSQKSLKYIWIDSVLNADSEYDISFDLDCNFLNKNGLNKGPKMYKKGRRYQYV